MPLLLFFLFPFAEFYSWYRFIDLYSFIDAVLLVFFGFGFGLLIIRTQGRNVLMNIQSAFAQGKLPERFILHRGVIIFGGLLIMLPGILTKMAGVMLILPGVRHIAVWYLKWYFLGKIAKGNFRVFMSAGMPGFRKSQNDTTATRDVFEIKPKKIEHYDLPEKNTEE